MNMFEKYDYLSSDYIPNNSTSVEATRQEIENVETKSIYNIKDEFIGYQISEGETPVIETGLVCKILVEHDAIIYSDFNEMPTMDTYGYVGRKAYNVVNGKVFTCVERYQETPEFTSYIWQEEPTFTYPTNGTKEIEYKPYASFDYAEVVISDFRYDKIKTIEVATTQDKIILSATTSNLLLQGVYNIETYVYTDNVKTLVAKCNLIVGNDVQ